MGSCSLYLAHPSVEEAPAVVQEPPATKNESRPPFNTRLDFFTGSGQVRTSSCGCDFLRSKICLQKSPRTQLYKAKDLEVSQEPVECGKLTEPPPYLPSLHHLTSDKHNFHFKDRCRSFSYTLPAPAKNVSRDNEGVGRNSIQGTRRRGVRRAFTGHGADSHTGELYTLR